MSDKGGSNLSRGRVSINDKLKSLVKNAGDIESIDNSNPLTDKPQRVKKKTTPVGKTKAKVSKEPKKETVSVEKPVSDKATDKPKETVKKGEKPKERATVATNKKEAKEPRRSKDVTKASKEVPETSLEQQENNALPDDFKSHTVRFSAEQYKDVKRLVNYFKWKQNPKYSIKEAFYSAVEELFADRVALEEFPEDFKTESVSISIDQFNRLNSFVGEVKFKEEDDRYSLQRAIYEAFDQFLKKNPIDL